MIRGQNRDLLREPHRSKLLAPNSKINVRKEDSNEMPPKTSEVAQLRPLCRPDRILADRATAGPCSRCRIQLQRAAAFDGRSAYLFADRDEDSAQSSLRAAPERRH